MFKWSPKANMTSQSSSNSFDGGVQAQNVMTAIQEKKKIPLKPNTHGDTNITYME
jgi:hypothetical protein